MKKQDVQAEIDFFDRVAEEDDSFSEGEYKKILDKIGPYLKGKTLEAGCSSGPFGPRLKQINPDIYVTGIDINQKFIDLAARRNSYDRLICANLEDKALFGQSELDTIFCPFVVHHFPDMKNVFSNFDYWLKSGGHIVIVDPNGSNLVLRASYFLRKISSKFIPQVNNYASVNESHKSVSDFRRCLRGYKACLIETFDRDQDLSRKTKASPIIYVLGLIRKVLLVIYRKTPLLKYKGSDLIIVARKR